MNKNNLKIAIITSRFNTEVTSKLKAGAIERLIELGISLDQIHAIDVPGAGEIPLIAQQFAKSKSVDAIICLGAVIRGETAHFDYVCKQVSEGCQQVMLKYDIPVIFYVLMTETEEQAYDRIGGAHGHKGHDAADCALEMIELMKSFA